MTSALARFFKAPLVASMTAALRFVGRDAASLIDGPLPVYRVTDCRCYCIQGPTGRRELREMTLQAADGAVLSFTVSLPTAMPAVKLPVVIILSGLMAGKRTLGIITDQGDNAWISYNYIANRARWKRSSTAIRFAMIWALSRRVADQVAVLAKWAQEQDWADAGRVNLIGISIGAVALPVSLRRLDRVGVKVGPSVIAFGGVDLLELLRTKLQELHVRWARGVISALAAAIFTPIEPATHLPHLSGEFLLINSKDDELIPAKSVARLHALTPDPKTIVMLDGDHIGSKKSEIVADTVGVVHRWLAERGAVNT